MPHAPAAAERNLRAVPLDYEKAERIYRMAIDRNVEDKTEVLNRLKELEKEKASKSR